MYKYFLGLALVSCGTESVVVESIKGDKGDQGESVTGPQGEIGPQGEVGDQGPQGIEGRRGRRGPQGEQGPAGQDGQDAPDLSAALQALQDQLDALEIDDISGLPEALEGLQSSIGIVKPCPNTWNSNSEVLFKINGKLYAVYDGGANSDRLAQLSNGNYVTTDGRSCHFTVSGGNVL